MLGEVEDLGTKLGVEVLALVFGDRPRFVEVMSHCFQCVSCARKGY
jgi:hypothetical protein